MRAVDTNVLVRLLTRDEPRQLAAAEAWVRQGAWVSTLTLLEAVRVLRSAYEIEREPLGQAIELLLDNEHLVLQDQDVVRLALEQFRARPTIGFDDAMILEVARKQGHLPLGTFDSALGKHDGAFKLPSR